MSLFSKLSSKMDELLSPKQDWDGWCEDVSKFCKEQASWYQESSLLAEKYVDIFKAWLLVDQSRLQESKDMIPLYGDQVRCWHEEEVRFHEDIARVHRDEARKLASCSHLHEIEARFHEDRAGFHQNKINECKLISDYLEDRIRCIEDCIYHKKNHLRCDEGKTHLYKESASLYQVKPCDMDLARKKLFDGRRKEFDVLERGLNAYGKDLKDRWSKLKSRATKLHNLCPTSYYGDGPRWNKLNVHFHNLNNRASNHSKIVDRLLQHPDVVQRRELIRILQNIYKVLSKRNGNNSLFLQNKKSAVTLTPSNCIHAIKTVLNWLESSIFKELGILGIKVVMTS
jgi:hypothetical protein